MVASTAGLDDPGLPGDEPRRGRSALFVALAVGAVLVALIALLATGPTGDRTVSSPLIGRPAPATAGTSIVGDAEFDLADADGRYTLVNFFATWCPPCIVEHPELVRFAAAGEARGDARVVTVVLQDDPRAVQRFFEREGGDWPVLDDPGGRLAVAWGVAQPPESYLVGPEGTVRAKIIGGISATELDELLARVQAGDGVTR
ncbi:MAG TPA: TlpA disulfide reductase family protein [Acidimicrobiales bacterium]|nr:TlpA disulfide reductase family protein [Acidimicrobiales bacterium]